MLWDWILAGGVTMATLILLSVISIGVVLERLSFFKQVRRATASLRGAIQQSFEKKEYGNALEDCRKSPSPLAAMILAEAASGLDAESADSERAMMLTMRGEMARLKQYLPILATVASIAPFVGLFGTCNEITTPFSHITPKSMHLPIP